MLRALILRVLFFTYDSAIMQQKEKKNFYFYIFYPNRFEQDIYIYIIIYSSLKITQHFSTRSMEESYISLFLEKNYWSFGGTELVNFLCIYVKENRR